MSDEMVSAPTRRNWIALAILVILAAACCMAVRAVPATADETCGSICVWTETGFKGAKGQTECSATGAHPLSGFKYSAKNHCATRAVWLRFNGSAVECLEWNTQDSAITFNELWVGAFESHC
jgi:hypothetical protein